MKMRVKMRSKFSASDSCTRRWILFSALFFSIIGNITHGRQVDLTILHTTDLHGFIWPTRDYDGRENLGGFLRCAAMIESIRAQKEDVLLIDCGDTFQGSPENYLAEGKLIIDGLNQLKYDAWVLGNHEFDWGPESLRTLHDYAEIPFLAANLQFKPGSENWLPGIKPYVIRRIQGLDVAIIGLVTPGIPRWSRPYLLNGATFSSSVETLAELMPEIKEKRPDIIIVAVHQGYKHRGDDFANEIQSIARAFPEIDVLLGGHTHTPVEDMRIGDVLYTQAGYHGIWLGQVDVTYDTVTRTILDKKSKLHLMDQQVAYHEKLLSRWSRELSESSNVLASVIGQLNEPLDTRADSMGNSSMQKFICRAIAEGTGAELVLHGSLAEENIKPGPLTYADIWRMVPYENTIGLISITPMQIREILMENLSRPVNHQSLGAYGFTFKLERKQGSIQIADLRDMAGEPLHPRKRYKVALNSYVLASGGERYMVTREIAELPESRLEMLELDTRRLVVEYIKRNSSKNTHSDSGGLTNIPMAEVVTGAP